MQSRVFQVLGVGGRSRPMFVGEWRDDFGVKHHGGMADLLLLPTIEHVYDEKIRFAFTVPLWLECKSGGGKSTPEQIAFAEHVIGHGAYHEVVHDSADALLAWFKSHGVQR